METAIGRHTIKAAGWQTWIGLVRLLVGFGRFVVLARLLPIEVFGQFGLATAVVGLSIVLPQFGLTAAFLHRSPQTREEEPAASVLFTLRLGLILVWALGVASVAAFLGAGGVRTALMVLVACQLLAEPAYVPRVLLIRRLQYTRIAVQEIAATIVGSAVAVVLAMSGAGLWALLATSFCHALLELLVFLGVSPVWRPRFAFDRDIVRYLLGFGARNLLLAGFDAVVEKLPELWTGLVLGTGQLGIYTRAARLASYPRRVATDPLVSVLPARLSELKERPAAFFSALTASLAPLTLGALLLAGGLWFVAPWVIVDLLGSKWLPALAPFRILTALIVLEPLRLALTGALVARGEPGRAARIRGVQAAVLVTGVGVGGVAAGLTGVAASVVLSGGLCVGLLAWAVMRDRTLFALEGLGRS